MTISPPDALRGVQRPRILSVPPKVSSAGQEAVELAASAGLVLDPWQAFVLDEALGERSDGRWSAFEVGLVVSRQNGKGSILEARALAGLFLFGEQLILHSAHEFKTASEGFRRVLSLIETTPDLARRIRKVNRAHGDEGIELTTGQRLRFVARTGGSGRGFSGDLVILDEAYNLGDDQMAALLPTLSARPNPQLWYTSSAGMQSSTQLAQVRKRGIAGTDEGLAYFEWSIDPHGDHCPPGCAEHDDADDPASWAKANPALGIRLSAGHVRREMNALSAAAFAQERLGVGDYPSDGEGWQVISEEMWTARTDPASRRDGRVAFSLDVTPDRSMGAIAVAGYREDELLHGEVVEHRRGTGWMVKRMVELAEAHDPVAIVVDGAGPAGNLIADLQHEGLEVLVPTTREVGQAFTGLYDAIAQDRFRHIGQAPLTAAIAGASTRNIGDGAQAWSRRHTAIDICPLVAVTNAVWGLVTNPESDPLDNIW